MSVFELSQLITNFIDSASTICANEAKAVQKMDRDEPLVKLVESESIIWQRNHPQFKNVAMKEQAWGRIALQLGVTTTDAERRFKSIREKYRRRKILLERDLTNNVEHSKLKRWDLYSKLGFLDDFMIPRNGSESLGTIKSESVSSENISSTNNEISIHPLPMLHHTMHTSTPTTLHNHHLSIRPMMQISQHQTVPQSCYSRSSQSTPSPSTTTANVTTDNMHLSPEVKMEVPDDEDEDSGEDCGVEQKACETGNFNYVGDFIAAELNKLPLRDAFVLKNILIREVLNFSDRLMMGASGSVDKQ